MAGQREKITKRRDSEVLSAFFESSVFAEKVNVLGMITGMFPLPFPEKS